MKKSIETLIPKDFEILLTKKQIQNIVKSLALKINKYYSKNFPNMVVNIIVVLNGATMFANDLMRKFNFDCVVDYIKVKSYPENQENSEDFKIRYDIDHNIGGKLVLVLDELADTCQSLKEIEDHLRAKKPRDLINCVAFRKVDAQKHEAIIDFIGGDIPDRWVIGYGLDGEDGMYRNLADLYFKK